MELLDASRSILLVIDMQGKLMEAVYRHKMIRAVLTNHESVGFEWTRDKNHAKFKEMSTLFKESFLKPKQYSKCVII